MKTKPIQILIADDHAIVRRGLRTLIETEPGMEVVGEAADGNQAVSKALALKPDVILMDLVMPLKSGIDAIVEIKDEQPDVRILVLTSFGTDDIVFPAIKAGALGYLIKDTSPEELLQSIRAVYQGKPSLHPDIAVKLMGEIKKTSEPPSAKPLSDRELEVLKYVASGLANQNIAEKLGISDRTVGTHVSNILAKLHLANRTQATLYAIQRGITDTNNT